VISASTLPWREGRPLLTQSGFALEDGVVVQKVRSKTGSIERRFRVDTLEPSYEDWLATPATPSAVGWLATEEATLLRAARQR
jgi:hypothetical protein